MLALNLALVLANYLVTLFSTIPTAVYTRVCHTDRIMEEHLFLVQSNVANIKGFFDFTFEAPNNAIISDSYDLVGIQIFILVEA